jgi:small basic protein
MLQEPRPTVPRQFNSKQVLVRFAFRLVLLITCATFGGEGFALTLAALLILSAVFCTIMAVMRREALFGPVLTHWDEAAACAALGHLFTALI